MNGSVITINISCLFGRELRQPFLFGPEFAKHTPSTTIVYTLTFSPRE